MGGDLTLAVGLRAAEYSGTRRASSLIGGLDLTRSHDYDVCDDQTLPGLQAATNQATAYRYGVLPLR
jgi:hypothetical protein